MTLVEQPRETVKDMYTNPRVEIMKHRWEKIVSKDSNKYNKSIQDEAVEFGVDLADNRGPEDVGVEIESVGLDVQSYQFNESI